MSNPTVDMFAWDGVESCPALWESRNGGMSVAPSELPQLVCSEKLMHQKEFAQRQRSGAVEHARQTGYWSWEGLASELSLLGEGKG